MPILLGLAWMLVRFVLFSKSHFIWATQIAPRNIMHDDKQRTCVFRSSMRAITDGIVFRRSRGKGAILLVDLHHYSNGVPVDETAKKFIDAEVRQTTSDSTTEKRKRACGSQ